MSIVSGSMGAVMGSSATTEAASTAAEAQNMATIAGVAESVGMMQAQLNLNQPWMQASESAIPYLQSAILGKPVSYNDPRYVYDVFYGQYLTPDGKGMTATPPQLTADYQPSASPALQYEEKYGQADLQRSLSAMGRGKSSYAAYLSGKLGAESAATDYNQQISRLSGLAGLGGGNANALTSAMGGASSNISGMINSAGQTNSLAALMSGQAQSSLYSGLGTASGNTVSTGMKLYDYGKTAGWWGTPAAADTVSNADIASAYDKLSYLAE